MRINNRSHVLNRRVTPESYRDAFGPGYQTPGVAIKAIEATLVPWDGRVWR